MKGLTLTLEVIIIAIVLLVTALVIMTIFGGQIAQFIGIINPWSEQMLNQNLCYQQCATWCQGNPGESGQPWDGIGKINTQSGQKSCGSDIGMNTVASGGCSCRGIPTGGGCTVTCVSADAGKAKVGPANAGGCTGGKSCHATCPASVPATGTTATGTCS